MSKIKAICISEKKGTQKHPVDSANLVEDWGIEGDAHAGHWHRQVSLLSFEKVEAFRARGARVDFGAFGENLVVEGFDFRSLPVGTRFQCGGVLLEMTQIGKECHAHCAIYQVMGDCIMPREGVFARVIRGGKLHVGDELTLLPPDPAVRRAAVVTLSDKGSRGERADESGPLLARLLAEAGYEVVEELLLPDEQGRIQTELIRLSDGRQCHLVLTTGGTGFSPRDVTPEATLAVATRNAPGIAEAIRAHSMTITPRAMLSRGASVLRNGTLIVNLPGSPKAAREGLEYILPALGHGLDILRGTTGECAR
ncbi:MOSC domain-containing protein [Candidatus Pseudoscillospira sp. SGI.172]|uniref:molybdopterin-binding protein n=1 Tax=Candidatus Pseudoscillospira sp. SGI.172 TaxID=3420582 RepID=UPI0009BC0BC3